MTAPGSVEAAILRILQDAGVPMTAAQVTTQARQKAGWARQYLDRLVSKGEINRTLGHNGRYMYTLPSDDD